MPKPGVETPYLTKSVNPAQLLANEVISENPRVVNTVLVDVDDLALKMAGSGALADAIQESREAAEAASAGQLSAESWLVLNTVAGTTALQGASVDDGDTGTHADPVTGATVPNAGRYRWSVAPPGWRWREANPPALAEAVIVSSGAPDASKVTALNARGKLDLSVLENVPTYAAPNKQIETPDFAIGVRGKEAGLRTAGGWVLPLVKPSGVKFNAASDRAEMAGGWAIGRSLTARGLTVRTAGGWLASLATLGSPAIITSNFRDRDVHYVNDRALARSQWRREIEVGDVEGYHEGGNVELCNGQSFEKGSRTNVQIQMTPDKLLSGVSYQALQVGDSDRCKTFGALYDHYGDLRLRALIDTAVTATAVLTQAQINNGGPASGAFGTTGAARRNIGFEKLWDRIFRSSLSSDLTRRMIVANTAVGESFAQQLYQSGSNGNQRSRDAMLKAITAHGIDFPGQPMRLSRVHQRHGTHHESYPPPGTPGASSAYTRETLTFEGIGTVPNTNYFTILDAYRLELFEQAKQLFPGQKRPAWFATQVSGSRGRPWQYVAAGQLSRALDKGPGATHWDFFLTSMDYTQADFSLVTVPGHPFAVSGTETGDEHPTEHSVYMKADIAAWVAFMVQVLRRNFFPTHVGEAVRRGNEILLGIDCMQAPIRISDVICGLSTRMLPQLGIHVENRTSGAEIEVVSATQVDSATIKLTCANDTTDARVVPAKGSVTREAWLASAQAGGGLLGKTNIRDSWAPRHEFFDAFLPGYTNIGPNGYVDSTGMKNFAATLGNQDMGNWLAAQWIDAVAMPTL